MVEIELHGQKVKVSVEEARDLFMQLATLLGMGPYPKAGNVNPLSSIPFHQERRRTSLDIEV